MLLANVMSQIVVFFVTLILIISNRLDKGWGRLNYLMDAMLWTNLALITCFMAAWLLEGRVEFVAINYIFTFGKCSLGFVIALIFTYYIAENLSGKCIVPINKIHIIAGVCLFAVFLNFVSIFNQMYFSCEGGFYARGPLFLLNQMFALIILLPAIILIVYYYRYLGKRNTLSLISYALFPIIAAVIQLPMEGLDLMCLATTLSLLTIYTVFHMERGKVLIEKEKELTDSRIAVMLTQIQPHFLYNSLGAIQDMCHDKAPEAESSIIAFTEFLRNNIDSLSTDKPISFEQELRHVQNYLSLEKKRFGERLRIVYNIATSNFRLPALTIQPMVENAVRYGVMQKEEGGTVKISTIELEKEYVIIIADDGVGFDLLKEKKDERTHIGISNVSYRLKTMVGGSLVVESLLQKGTIVKITIPKAR